MNIKTKRFLSALCLIFLVLVFSLGLVACDTNSAFSKTGEQKIITRLVHDKNGREPLDGMQNTMQNGKGAKENKVPVYITTSSDGSQYAKMSFEAYTNVYREELIYPARTEGDKETNHSYTVTTYTDAFEIKGKIDGEIEPIDIKAHYTYATDKDGILIDEDVVFKAKGKFVWQKALDTLELHIYWTYSLQAPNYHGNLRKGDNVEVYRYYVFDLPKNVSNQDGTLSVTKIDTVADKDSGETSVNIPQALAIVIIGGAAAIVGAGSSKSGDKNEDDKKSSFKMCLKKDFTDAIRYDSPPSTVYARIVEINDKGEEIDRPDLSAAIEMFSSGGLKIESTAMADNYMAALICAESVKGEENPDTGILSIRFSNEAGLFQNDVSFRLINNAYVHFPDRKNELTATVNILYGDNADYEINIELVDFIMLPQDIRLELQDNSYFTTDTKKIDDSHYKIIIHNISELPSDKAKQLQTTYTVTVYAESEKDNVHNSFIVNLLPEGLSLRPFTFCPLDENGILHVACSLSPEQSEDETEIEQTHFQLVLAVANTDESGKRSAYIVDSNDINCQFEDMTAQGDKLQNLLKSFSYEIDYFEAKSAGIYRICPKRQLPQDDRLDYDVVIPVSCDYENQSYKLDIPLRLHGDKLLPMAEKSEEVAILIKRIKKFVNEEDRARVIRGFKDDLAKMSASDVRLLSKSLVYATQAEVYKANAHLLDAKFLDWIVWGLEWYKWIGDQAISVIISKFSYSYGPIVEAVLMPAKDLLVEHFGIWLSDYVNGKPSPSAEYDLEQLESLGLTMIENILTNLIDGKTDPKKAAQILSVYLVIKTANYYFFEKNEDGSPLGIYGAITSAFGDLTAQSFKIILGTKLEQLAKNPATTKIFGKYADDFIKGLFPAEFYDKVGELEFDIIKKYIEEITVLASSKVYTGLQEGVENDLNEGRLVITLIENLNNPEKTIKISTNPIELGQQFFDYIFDRIFSFFTFADSTVESPKDPIFKLD